MHDEESAKMRSNAAEILINSGYDPEKVLSFVDFPIIENMGANGNFEELKLLGTKYTNSGSGVAINQVKKRDVRFIELQEKRNTTCKFNFKGYYPGTISELKENKEAEESEPNKRIYLNYLKRGDVLRVWFDDTIYYSVFSDDDDSGDRYISPWETGFNLYELKFPLLNVFPQKIRIEYGCAKAIADFSTGLHPPYYIDGEMSFIHFSGWSRVCNLFFRFYVSAPDYARILTNIIELTFNGSSYDITQSYVNVGGAYFDPLDSSDKLIIYDPEYFHGGSTKEKKSNSPRTFKKIPIKLPKGWRFFDS